MPNTESYIVQYLNHKNKIEAGKKYYFGEITNGQESQNKCLYELTDGIGWIGEKYDNNRREYLVAFKVISFDKEDFMRSIVEIVKILEV